MQLDPTPTPTAVVEAESRTRIQVYLETRERWNTVASLSDLTQKVAHEYENRFLIELIQNGYDAHERGSRGGRVWVRLDETVAGHGALYVANTGRPFEFQNFDALSNIARSNKPPGQGIGNKGLGFRSVLQVCDWPEVYSSSPDVQTDPGFSGYCFGFATDEDLRLLTVDDDVFAAVARDFSRYLLPVPRIPNDPALTDLRQLGAVTVVRLPLKSEQALTVARAQIVRLVEASEPVLLFLDRLDRLDVDQIDGTGVGVHHTLTRTQSPVDLPLGDRSECSEVETAGRRYLLAKRVVPQEEVGAVIRETIEANQLDPAWDSWDGDAEVSLALPLGGAQEEADDFALFTFLPMDVLSPLGGHLNAPFYTKLARVDLREDVRLNSYFLDVAADLCAVLLKMLVEKDVTSFPEPAGVVADLLTWDGEHIGRLERALAARGLDLHESNLVPSRLDDRLSWISLTDAYLWDEQSYTCLTIDRLGMVDAKIVDSTIGARRIRRLEALHQTVKGRGLTPADDVLAGWLEQIAAALVGPSLQIDEWNAFYDDVASHFAGTGKAQCLQGRKILIDQDGRLRRAGPWDDRERASRDPTVFFPPRRAADVDDDIDDDVADDEEELRVPRSLQRAVSFLHDGINLRGRDGPTTRRTPIIDLLEDAKLVERFDRRSILSHLRRILRGRPAESTRKEALRWVYLQHRASRSGLRGLDELGLSVPTRAGWQPADEAFFSGQWPGTQGRNLEHLIDAESESSPSLAAISGALLLSPGQWPVTVGDVEQWRDFLAMIGVSDGIWPIGRAAPVIEQDGLHYNAGLVARHFNLPEEIEESWTDHVSGMWGGYAALAHPYTSYRGDAQLWCLPGQEGFERFRPDSRRLYASLILTSIGDWRDEHFAYTFERHLPQHRSKPDAHRWPSPLCTFIERAEWFPMSDPRRRADAYYVPLGDGWYYDDGDREPAPRFARLSPVDQRRRIGSNERSRAALADHGLRTWNDGASAQERLVELARLLELGLIGEVETASFRLACERAWAEALPEDEPGQDISLLPLVVSAGRELSVLTSALPAGEQERRVLYIEDAGIGLVHHILEAARRNVLVAAPRDGAHAAQALAARHDLDVRVMSSVRADVIADGAVVVPGPETGVLLVETLGRWLPRLVAVAITLQPNRVAPVTERVMHDALARLRRVRLLSATEIAVTIDDEPIQLPPAVERCLHIDDGENPVIVTQPSDDGPEWQQLESLAVSLALLIGQRSAAEPLRIAAYALGQSLGDRWREPTDDELAAIFRVSTERIAEVTAGLRAEIEYLTFSLLPAVVCLASIDEAGRVEAVRLETREELAELLELIVGSASADRLLSAAERTSSADELRNELEIPLGDFNRALRALGRPPIHYVDEHEAAFRGFVAENRHRLLDAIRVHFLSEFTANRDLSPYVQLRPFPGLDRDPTWLETSERPSEEEMQTQVDLWLERHAVRPAPASSGLTDIDTVRQINEELLDESLPSLRDLVTAWCGSNSHERSDLWADTTRVREQLHGAGCMDFSQLDTSGLMAWLDTLGLWPAGMPKSTELNALGLSEADVLAAKSATEHAKQQRARANNSIALDGEEYEIDDESLRRLVEVARNSPTDQFLATTPRVTKLEVLPPPRPTGDKPPSGGGGKRRGRPRPSDELTRAIGLVGEVLAYEWLQKAYDETTSDSWVSGSRALGIGGYEGDDTLGYDFEIVQRSQTLHFEVKATAGAEYEFEMGVSELREARRARRGTYRIIFIRHALDRDNRELIVLPNPLEPEHAPHFGQVNEGVKFRFGRQ